MRRVVGAYVAALVVLAGVLAAPAAADDEPPPQVRILEAPPYLPIDARPQLIGAGLDQTPSGDPEVHYEWELDGDNGFDDAVGNAIFWNPAQHDLGTYTVSVRATVNGLVSTASTEILVIAAFKVALGNPIAVAGRKSSIGATVQNFPMNSILTYAWELDGDGDFNDIADSSDDLIEPIWNTPGDYPIQVRVIHDQLAPDAPAAVASTNVHVIAPVTLTAAGVSGTAKAGYLLTSTGATPTPSDALRTRTWLRDGVPITGATGSTYRLTTSDSGRRVTVRVGATKDGWGDALPVSRTVAVAAACVVRPTITGTARVGRRLTGSKGTWRAPSHTFTYRWLRDGRPITGATRTTYLTTRADRGHRISFRVTAQRTGFPSVAATSAARTVS